ncbi:hypothetical protein [Burkholderia gladioli]|uniref:hypothetical protein n=1 Tax=Burkholderia gladioli TaxID=28095 RepID=UPI001C278E39|nr:hypothetical protein [Burkholderia gladioli]MBU9379401.1 hypothetical protein [Burkholderia gladioli]
MVEQTNIAQSGTDQRVLLIPEGLFESGKFCALGDLAQGLLIELARQASFLGNGTLSFVCVETTGRNVAAVNVFLAAAHELNASGLATWVRTVKGTDTLATFWAVSWLDFSPLDDTAVSPAEVSV